MIKADQFLCTYIPKYEASSSRWMIKLDSQRHYAETVSV